MASFHFAVKSISRGKGHSSTAAAAYRLGIKIECERTGVTHNYTKKKGVLHAEMKAPKGAPAWTNDPATFWNKVEERDTRANARVAREFVVSLPHELSLEANIQLARDIADLVVDRYQTVAQIAIHAPDQGGDDRNIHLHLMFAPRTVGPEGFGDYTGKVYDDFKKGPAEILAMREYVAMLTNNALFGENLDARVDHRRLIDQALEAVEQGDLKRARELDRLPTVKEGKKPLRARTQRRRNRRIRQSNEAIQTKWDLIEGKARAESRLMPPYSDERSHDERKEPEQARGSGTQPRRTHRVIAPITAAKIDDYREWRNSPSYKSLLIMPEGRGAPVIKPGWLPERPARVLSGNESRPASVGSGVHAPRKNAWRSKGVPKPITAAIFNQATPKSGAGSTKATASADHYGRERMRMDEERLQLEMEALADSVARLREQNKRASDFARADQHFIQQMTSGRSANQIAWTRHHKRVRELSDWLEDQAKEQRNRLRQLDRSTEELGKRRFELNAWAEKNPKPKSMAEQVAWQEAWNARYGDVEKLRVSVEELQHLATTSQLGANSTKRKRALVAMEEALRERRAIARLPSEENDYWKTFRFPAKQTGPPEQSSGINPIMTYPRLEPPKR